jgi:hypothetical protein
MSVYVLNDPPTVGASQRFELLQQAHALEPLARVQWRQQTKQRPARDWLITNRDAWLAVAGRVDLAIQMDREVAQQSSTPRTLVRCDAF